ncbi:mitochondrial GTPase 1 [Macrosteles quadrilineatus]|uniref:mitochondrial GTPase 1 n=1 Tax=Macrosteles quadrilineatus TaxID=74068 RepID=UPI0023E12224|nr:mitochondrial GTPase 1 [Macrosteles quadrilineatus]
MVFLSHRIYAAKQFRTTFQLKNKSVLHWFPGHMGKGVKEMQKKLKSVDCIIEMHDARIPFSGRNPDAFQTISGLKPHILVYNKKDLADNRFEKLVVMKHKEQGFENVLFTDCRDDKCRGLRKLIPLVQKEIANSSRYNRSENKDSCLMVIGVPNVGKSSLINLLRNKYMLKSNAVRVGAAPGITRSVGSKIKISDDPLIYIYDTPGILTPKVPSVEDGMKLALCSNIPDKEVGLLLIADFLLFWMNKHGRFEYVNFLDCENPSDDISEVLALSAVKNDKFVKVKHVEGKYVSLPNIEFAALQFITAFRKGLFGPTTLDIDKINFPEKNGIVSQRRIEGWTAG